MALPWCEDRDRPIFPWGMHGKLSVGRGTALGGLKVKVGWYSPGMPANVLCHWGEHNELHYLIMLMSGWQWSFLKVAVIPSQIASGHCSPQRTFLKNMFDVFLCFEKNNDHIAYLRRTRICMCVCVGVEGVGRCTGTRSRDHHCTRVWRGQHPQVLSQLFPKMDLSWNLEFTDRAAQTTGISSVPSWTVFFFSLNAFLWSTRLPGSSPKPRTRML